MPYQALFAIHLVAVATFVAVLLLTAVMLPGITQADAARLRALNLYLASPALGFVWICGIGMVLEAGWFAMPWLRAKVVLVLLLSAAHGRQTVALRKIGTRKRRCGYWPLVIEVSACILVIGLAVLKPA